MFLPFLVRGTPYNGQHMRFLRAVCGRSAAPCGETEGRTPTRDAASRAVDPSFLRNPQRQRVRCEKAGLRHAFRDSARRMSLKTMHFARFPSASALPTRKKRLHPDAGCGFPGCRPPLPPQSAAAALPARFLGFGAPNVSQNHAPCTASRRVGFAKRKKGRTPTRDAASGLSFRRWRCFGCGSCGRRCRRGRPAPRACRTRRCARPG